MPSFMNGKPARINFTGNNLGAQRVVYHFLGLTPDEERHFERLVLAYETPIPIE